MASPVAFDQALASHHRFNRAAGYRGGASFEKFVLDCDLIQMVGEFMQPLETTEDALGVEAGSDLTDVDRRLGREADQGATGKLDAVVDAPEREAREGQEMRIAAEIQQALLPPRSRSAAAERPRSSVYQARSCRTS